MKAEEKKAILLFFVLFLTWHILYFVNRLLNGLDSLLAYVVVLAVAVCFFILDKQKTSDLGLKKPSLWKRYVFAGFAFAVVVILYWVGLSSLLPTAPQQVLQYGALSVAYNASFSLVVGFLEETSFRGYILANFRKVHSDTKAIIYSSLLFGLYHISFVWIFLATTPPSQTFTYWSSYVLFTFVVGLFLGYFYVNAEQTTIGTITHHSSHIFLSSIVPYTLAVSFTIGHLLNTSAYVVSILALAFLKRIGWLTSSRKPDKPTS